MCAMVRPSQALRTAATRKVLDTRCGEVRDDADDTQRDRPGCLVAKVEHGLFGHRSGSPLFEPADSVRAWDGIEFREKLRLGRPRRGFPTAGQFCGGGRYWRSRGSVLLDKVNRVDDHV